MHMLTREKKTHGKKLSVTLILHWKMQKIRIFEEALFGKNPKVRIFDNSLLGNITCKQNYLGNTTINLETQINLETSILIWKSIINSETPL